MELKQRRRTAAVKVSVVAACFVMICVCLGFCSSNKSLYLSAITKALDINRSLFSINDSFRYITTAVVNLFFGTLIVKYGARKLVAAGFLCLILSTLIYSHATHVAAFYLGGCFLGAGLSWTTTTMASYLVNRWFKENRGTISGLILCANGLGGAAAAQIVTPIIYRNGNPFGYRDAYNLVALLLLIAGVFVVCLIREPSGEAPSAPGKKSARGKHWQGISAAEAFRKPYFYAAAVCVFLTGMSLQGINGIAGAHLTDVGMETAFIASVLSVHSIVLCGSKFLAGFSYDKLGLRVTLLICESCGLLSFVALSLAGTGAFGTGCAFAWSILSSLALPLETVMVPLIAADLFGEKEFSRMVGIFVSINVAGYAFGTPVANVIFDLTGTYRLMFYLIAAGMLAIMAGFHFIINAANDQRRRLGASEEPSSGDR